MNDNNEQLQIMKLEAFIKYTWLLYKDNTL